MKKRGAEKNTQVSQSSHCDYPKRSRHRQLLSALLLLLVVSAGASVKAQVCTLIPNGGGQGISPTITIQSTGAELANGAVIPTGTALRLDAVANADGSCSQVGPGCFGVAERTINHINVQSDISTTGGLNGHFVEGYVFGDGYYHVLDTRSSSSTGPLYTTLFAPGTYQYHFWAPINTTTCEIPPDQTETVTITIYVRDNGRDLGGDCFSEAGKTTVGKLAQVSRLGIPDVWYKYDALGRRIERNKGIAQPIPLATETTRFVYDGADVMRDLDGNGATSADYLNGPGIDNKFRQTSSSAVSYFAADHLGSTRAATDASGSVSSSVSYDSFGNVVSGSASTRYTFTGRESDSDTGLMYYRARWYDSQQGRFLAEDPIGLEGGLNLYGYVRNNPVNFKDPFGRDLFGVTGGGSAGAAVGGLGIMGNTGYMIGINTNCACEGDISYGGAGNIGIAAGPDYGYPEQHDGSGGLGATLGAGAGLFWSNAPSYSSLAGTFATTIISTPFGVGVEINKSGPIVVVSVTYGKSWGAGIFHLTTNTPKWTTWDTKCSRFQPILV